MENQSNKGNFNTWLSSISIAIALFALYQSYDANKARVAIIHLPVYTITEKDQSSTYHIIRLIATNSGGRAVNLIRIVKQKGQDAISGLDSKHEKISLTDKVELFLPDIEIKDVVDLQNVFSKHKLKRISVVEGLLVKKTIGPGEACQIDLGVKTNKQISEAINTINLSLVAEFSDNQKSEINATITASGKPRQPWSNLRW